IHVLVAVITPLPPTSVRVRTATRSAKGAYPRNVWRRRAGRIRIAGRKRVPAPAIAYNDVYNGRGVRRCRRDDSGARGANDRARAASNSYRGTLGKAGPVYLDEGPAGGRAGRGGDGRNVRRDQAAVAESVR